MTATKVGSRSAPWFQHYLHGIRLDRFPDRGFHIAQRETMGDKFPQRIVLQVADHLAHAGTVRGWLLPADGKYAGIFRAEMPVRAKRNFSQIGKVSRFHE